MEVSSFLQGENRLGVYRGFESASPLDDASPSSTIKPISIMNSDRMARTSGDTALRSNRFQSYHFNPESELQLELELELELE